MPLDKNDAPEEESTRPDSIMDGRLYVKHNLECADAVNASFFANPVNQAHLGLIPTS
jgi:hypothetical protein